MDFSLASSRRLQPVATEIIEGLSRNASRPDIRARGVWRVGRNAFFDVRVTNTHSIIHLTTESVLKKHEQEKKQNYNRHIMNIEHGSFTTWVFSGSEGMSKECSMFHKHIAGWLTIKRWSPYKTAALIWDLVLSKGNKMYIYIYTPQLYTYYRYVLNIYTQLTSGNIKIRNQAFMSWDQFNLPIPGSN